MKKLYKRKTVLLVVVLILIVFFTMKINERTSLENDNLEMELLYYMHATINFTSVTANQVSEMLDDKQPFFLYVGRATCPNCRKIAPILYELTKDKNLTILYLDSEETESDLSLKQFRKEHNISEVPAILFSSGNGELYFIEVNYGVASSNIKQEMGENIEHIQEQVANHCCS